MASNILKPLTVVTFAWGGSRPIYGPWQVVNMKRQCAKHITIPHRFVVVTDAPRDYYEANFGVESFPLWTVPPIPMDNRHWLHNYVRLGLFDAEIGGLIGERLLNIDLDAIIRENIDDIVSDPEPFKVMSLKSRTQLQGGLFLVEPGMIEPNPWAALRDDPTLVERSHAWVGSDQAVMSELFYGSVPTWDEEDGLIINRLEWPGWRIFFRTGPRKCWDVSAPEREIYFHESGRSLQDVPPPATPYTRPSLIPQSPHLAIRRRGGSYRKTGRVV